MINICTRSMLTLLTLVYAFNASAINCEEQSPTLIAEGDAYYNFEENNALTRQQKQTVDTLFAKTKKRLEGQAVEIYCVKNNDVFEEVSKTQQLKASLDIASDGKVIMDLAVYVPEQKTGFNEIIEYLNMNSTFAIKQLSANKMRVSTKYRRVQGTNTSSLHETIADFSVNNGVITLRTTLYINGYFALARNMQLQ
ncbi:MAG: hypothetical protein OEY11_02490 [Gammaproteobacteria bacterium]|nr:hypothetical protein [Gammaproteobacteria bacterium]